MHRRSHLRALARCAPLLAALALLTSIGCGGSTSEPLTTQGPTHRAPYQLVVVTSPTLSAQPDTRIGTFALRLEDADGKPVSGAKIAFDWTGGGSFLFSPVEDTTSATGDVKTLVSTGRTAGTGSVRASTTGVTQASASVAATVVPGPPVTVDIQPRSMRLFGAGDTASFTAVAVDAYGNVVPGTPLSLGWDRAVVDVTAPGTLGDRGRVRALKGGGSSVTAAFGNVNYGTMGVQVFEKSRTACSGIATAQGVPADSLVTATGSTFCIDASTSEREFAMIAYNGSTDGSQSLATTVTGYNVTPTYGFDPLAARVPFARAPTLRRTSSLMQRASAPTLDLRFHQRLLTQSRSLRTLFNQARAARWRPGIGRISAARLSTAAVAAPTPAVDDLVALNVATSSCSNADVRTFRVEAVGSAAIVLADTTNPTGGFSRTDYQRFAARFDTLVFPLDRDAFGQPTDIDGNGHVAILFSRAVNELTPAGAGAFVGGFFHPRDLFPRAGSTSLDACATSNEGEMFYMIVPDPTGVVNGNTFARGMVDTLTTGILAHEFQHLINAGRRMYVNTTATDFEETWLNEGLSHVAEELLYFRESGTAPRLRLASSSFFVNGPRWDYWVADESSNFVRFYLYLLDPANHSPIDVGDELETRGATWAFLRYAVDQEFTSDDLVWQRFSNSTVTGLATLQAALQRDPRPLIRDFAVANLAGPLSNPRYRHPSWNFDDVYTEVFNDHAYPLPFVALGDAAAAPVSVRGGSASYLRFTVPANAQGLLQFGTSQTPPDADLSFRLVRLR